MNDEVDEVVSGWRVARPDVDVEPLQLLSRVGRLAQILDDRRERAFAVHGLATHEFDVLAALRRRGPDGELTPGELSEITHVTSGTMTNRLDRLQRRRLIARRRHPEDGRQNLIRLTAAGRRRVDGALTELLDYERAIVDALNDRDRAATVRALRTLLAAGSPPDS